MSQNPCGALRVHSSKQWRRYSKLFCTSLNYQSSMVYVGLCDRQSYIQNGYCWICVKGESVLNFETQRLGGQASIFCETIYVQRTFILFFETLHECC